MNLPPNANRLDLNSFSYVARIYARIVYFLLLMTTFSLITAPLTQHIWTWDHFLHGGQDFEFGVLVVLMTLCLGLLLAQHCKQNAELLHATYLLFSFICYDHLLARITPSEAITAFRSERVPNPSLGIYNLPLLV